MYLPYFGQDLESKKKVVGILAHVWFLCQFFVKNARNDSRTPFEQPKSDKIWKSGKYRNPKEQSENGRFRHLKYLNSVIFKTAT